jgi:hypothetical protein
MPPKNTAETYKKFMASGKQISRSRCASCGNKTVADLIVCHLDALQREETSVSLSHLHRYLLVEHGAPKSFTAICNHVNHCLRRNPRTGEPHAGPDAT